MGNAKASGCGTGDEFGSHVFFYIQTKTKCVTSTQGGRRQKKLNQINKSLNEMKTTSIKHLLALLVAMLASVNLRAHDVAIGGIYYNLNKMK